MMFAFLSPPTCSIPRGPSSGSNLCTRRSALLLAAAAAASRALPAAAAVQYGKPSTSDLLRKIDKEKSEEELASEKEARAAARAERMARQRELAEGAERRRATGDDESEGKVDIEANLRANYYYPTGRKRYLPRVKRANDEIERIGAAVREERWPDVGGYLDSGGSLDDLVLPMRLYASGLSGQGLSLTGGFLKVMSDQATQVEDSLKTLRKAAKKRDTSTALACVSDIQRAIASYRAAGKLEAPDFGIGEVPKDAKVGSGLGNNNPALYNRNFNEVAGKSR